MTSARPQQPHSARERVAPLSRPRPAGTSRPHPPAHMRAPQGQNAVANCNRRRWLASRRPSGSLSAEVSRGELLEELVPDCPCALVDLYLHRRYLRVDLLHEHDYEIDELVLPHGLEVEVGQQEGHVIALSEGRRARSARGARRDGEALSRLAAGVCASDERAEVASGRWRRPPAGHSTRNADAPVAQVEGGELACASFSRRVRRRRHAGARLTGMGFRRSTIKLSARCMRKRENLLARIASISSSCFTLMLIRTELTAVSIITHSCSERWMTIGLSSSSLLALRAQDRRAR